MFYCFVVKFIVCVYACGGLGPKAVNKKIYLSTIIAHAHDKISNELQYTLQVINTNENIKAVHNWLLYGKSIGGV